MVKKIALFCLIITILFVFSACGKKADTDQSSNTANTQEETSQDQEQEDTQTSEKSTEDTNTETTEEAKGVVLPDGYPVEFVPIMENAVSGSGMNLGGDFRMLYTTPSTIDEALEFYTNAFSKYGDKFVVADSKLEINVEGDTMNAQIFFEESDGQTTLNIAIYKQ